MTALILAQPTLGFISKTFGEDTDPLPTYVDLVEHGRPASLFRLETSHSGLCDKVVKELNEPFYEENRSPLQTLLHASSAISWYPKKVHTADGGTIQLLKIGDPDLSLSGDIYKVVSVKADLREYPMEKLVIVKKAALESAQDNDGVVANHFVNEILEPQKSNSVRPVDTWPLVEKKVRSDAGQAKYLPANTYTLNALLIDQHLLAVLAPPYLFDNEGNLRENLITFVVSLSAPESALCYLTY
ncbi:hypothetical protein ACFPL7_24205 [Dongia soli]|uniref:Uncharacterized protein n=1 Tax=Dongia soli TaxID=600628 RepID=A0ABU5EGC1_9PROT|nr:hypothetical protein [Dongia soli]MDY0885406.1 hypothetical protein [Dongia soli]